MPIVFDGHVMRDVPAITKMPLRRLIEYEALLWHWMDKADSPVWVANQLNAIHREVEWRAQDTDWRKAR